MPSKHINATCKTYPPKRELRRPGFVKLVRKKGEPAPPATPPWAYTQS